MFSSRCLSHAKSFRHLSLKSGRRKTLPSIQAQYARKEPLTMVTAYDYPTALHADRADMDIILVGDSVGMVVLGNRTTQSVTLDQMIHHCQAARKATKNALLVADLPFGTYESSPQQAVDSAIRLVKETEVDAVKLEGGRTRASILSSIVESGVAVMGHIGLLPQSVSRAGGFHAAGRTAQHALRIIDDAQAAEEAGAFAIVVECVPQRVAGLVTGSVDVPTIGIGSGALCDGQVLVYHDMLGILSHPHHANNAPRFSKTFAEVGINIDQGIREYGRQVRAREFPCENFSPYSIPDDEFREVERFVGKMKQQKLVTKKEPTKSNSKDSNETIDLY